MKNNNNPEKNWSAIITTMVLRCGLTAKGAEYVSEVVSSPPSRLPSNAGGQNLLVDLASRKMGHTVQVESLSVEAAYAQMLEIATSCIGYWPQPIKLPILYTDSDGVKRTRWVTFDFLVIETDGVWLVECKTEDQAIKLSKKTPGRFRRKSNGDWDSPETDASLKQYGIKCRIVSSAKLNPTLLRNFSVLEEARQDDYSSTEALECIKKHIPDDGVALGTLLAEAGAQFSKNDVYFGIMRKDLHALLDVCLLADDRTTYVFSEHHHADAHRLLHVDTKPVTATPIILKPGTRILWNGTDYSVCNASADKIYLQTKRGDPLPIPQRLLNSLMNSGEIEVLEEEAIPLPAQQAELARFQRVLSSEEVARAKSKQQFLSMREIEPTAEPEHFGLKASLRTIQRWCKAARQSLTKFGTSFWGLLEKPRPGRTRDDLPAEIRDEMTTLADDLYFSKDKRSLSYVWRALRDNRQKRGLHYPSKGAFRRHVRRMKNAYDAAKARDGKKAAYKLSSSETGMPNWITAGDFPFKVGQMDGKLMDIALVDEETGEYLGKPTLTLTCLPHYGAVPIAWTLLFEPESYRSATMTIRDMMERHGEPVKYLIVDNGKAFENATFDLLLASLEITKVNRRPYDPRFASEIESLFRTIDREFVHNLAGNTKSTQERETATEEMDPSKRAVWTFQKFHQRLEEYLLSLWDAPSASLGTTPRIALERDRKSAPNRQGRFVLPPDQAKVAYLPEVDGGTRRVQPARGISIDGHYYWNDLMERASVEKTKVGARYDPFDLYLAYAAIDGKWAPCEARNAPELRNVSERTRRIASLVTRTLKKSHANRREDSHGVRLGALGRKTRDDEKVMRESRRANAQRHALKKNASPPPSPAKSKLPKVNFSHLKKSA